MTDWFMAVGTILAVVMFAVSIWGFKRQLDADRKKRKEKETE